GQLSGDTVTFTTASNNVSARPRTSAFVNWTPANWPTVGAAGPDQRTPNVASIVQEIVNQATWASGHALVIIITGTGHRVAVAHDGTPAGAPLLHVEYGGPPTTTTSTTSTTSSTTTTTLAGATTLDIRVAASTDDAEQSASGSLDLTSSDLELVQESTTQVVGVRYAGVTIPAHATIDAAYVQFLVDEVSTA